jgi:putative membrane protein
LPDETGDRAPLAETARRGGLGPAMLAALSAVLLLAAALVVDVALTIDQLVATAPLAGWALAGLAGVLVLALVLLSVREAATLARLRRIEAVQAAARSAVAAPDGAATGWRAPADRQTPDDAAVDAALARLERLYARRDDLAWGLARYRERREEMLDPLDRLALFEAEVLAPLDNRAREAVARSAGTTAVFTSISPFVALDMAVSGWRNLKLVREIAVLYGGRPGLAGAMALVRRIFVGIALTGGFEAGDSVIGGALGGGLAAKVSTRLGQGVINGLLTGRIGIGAIKAVRPMPYLRSRPPRLGDVTLAIGERLRLKLGALGQAAPAADRQPG